MTQKLILAEGLDLLRQCEVREYEVDKLRSSFSKSSKPENIMRLFQSYDELYREFTRGLMMLNYVRRSALGDTTAANAAYSRNLIGFCSGKLTVYMERAENVAKKKDSILFPLDYVETIGKPGFSAVDTLYTLNGAQYPLGGKDKLINQVHTVSDGTYAVTVKNTDSYSVAAPDVTVTITLTPQSGGEPFRLERRVAGQTGFRRFVGAVGPSTLQVQVRSSGMRDAHVDVTIVTWREIGDYTDPGAGVFGGGDIEVDALQKHQPPTQKQQRVSATSLAPLPRIPDDELAQLANYNVPTGSLPSRGGSQPQSPPPLTQQQQQQQQASAQMDAWATLEHTPVPHVGGGSRASASGAALLDPIVVSPAGLTCDQRLQRVRQVLDAWPQNGVMAANLGSDEQRVLQGVYGLPFPTELGKE